MAERPTPDGFTRLGDLLLTTATSRDAGGDRARRVAAVWEEVVGAEVAANARPVQLRDGRLVVTTSSAAWAQTLQLMSPLVVERVNERLGEEAVERAVFRHAGWGAPVAPEAAKAGENPVAAGGKADLDSDLDPGLESHPETDRASGYWAEPETDDEADRTEGLEGFSAEESQALADLEDLPLAPSAKQAIREAMKAGFARAKQDFGRS